MRVFGIAMMGRVLMIKTSVQVNALKNEPNAVMYVATHVIINLNVHKKVSCFLIFISCFLFFKSAPCRAEMVQSCICGELKKKVLCGATSSQPGQSSEIVLDCDEKCAIKMRNTMLASALGVIPHEPLPVSYEPFLLNFAKQSRNTLWVLEAESAFMQFVENPIKQSHSFPTGIF